MNRFVLAALALLLATGAQARALFVTTNPLSANNATGIARLHEATTVAATTLGGAYDVANILDFTEGSTDAMRRGAWYKSGISSTGDSALYGLVVLVGDDTGTYTSNYGSNTSSQLSVDNVSYLRSTLAGAFAWARPGMVVTGTGITTTAVVLGVDSLAGQRMLVRGATTYSAGPNTITWRTPLRPDSLTLSSKYPRVPILRFGQYMGTAGAFLTSTRCSSGVGNLMTYAAHEDSTVNVYEVGNPYRSWKARQAHVVNATRDPRGWRPILARVMTRKNEAAHANGNYDFPDPVCSACAFSANPDTVTLWLVQNRDATGALLGGDAAPNIYCATSPVNLTSNIDPGTVLVALNLADSLSGGALFGASKKLPRPFSIGIDDGWKRGDSRFNLSYGGIAVDDTAAFKASIDSLASLRIPFALGVELDSLGSVLLAAGVTGDGAVYDRRWWRAAEPWVHYTPHCHAGITGGTTRPQNVASGVAGKYARMIDIYGLSRTRTVWGSPDSALAGLGTDFWNDEKDTLSIYWLGKRALALCDSTFGARLVDHEIIPAGGCWTPPSVTRTNALAVDSLAVAFPASGYTGTRALLSINMVGNPLDNTFGYYNTFRRMNVGLAAGGVGMPSWIPSSLYGRPCQITPIGLFSSGASVASWSGLRNNSGGEKNLWALLIGHQFGDGPTGYAYNLTTHCGDFGSSGYSGEATRPMFYTIKYIVNAVRVANAHGRQDLVRFVYPEDVRP